MKQARILMQELGNKAERILGLRGYDIDGKARSSPMHAFIS